MIKLFVGGFPPHVSELELVQLIDRHGQVSTIKIVRDKVTKKSKGYAFVEFTEREDADAVLESLDCAAFKGSTLNVRFAIAQIEGPAHKKFNRAPVGTVKR